MNDIEYGKMRLENILASQKLNYNPYKVSDKELIQTFNKYNSSAIFTELLYLYDAQKYWNLKNISLFPL